MDTRLPLEIKAWIKDYRAIFPSNVQIDDMNDDTLEGSAYNLLTRALQELKTAHKKTKLIDSVLEKWDAPQ